MMPQLLAHLWGDYLLQSDWMAGGKRQAWRPALAHALMYSIAFLWLTSSPRAWLVICGSHLLIDRFGVARYLVWAKNWLAPPELHTLYSQDNGTGPRLLWEGVRPTPPWQFCTLTGYPSNRPAWLTVWLTIIADNTLHLTINYLALRYL